MKTYLKTLITEKGQALDNTMSVLEAQGHFGITYSDLIEFICQQPKEVQAKVKATLVQIDFKNGDVFDFFNHMAKGMMQAAGY